MVYHLHIYLNYILHILIPGMNFPTRTSKMPLQGLKHAYRCSFFPSAIHTWNSLDPSVKNSSTLNEFKIKLIANMATKKVYYALRSRCVISILASIHA